MACGARTPRRFCMSMRRGRAFGLIAVGVVGLLAGCNGSPSSRILSVAESSTASAAPSTSITPGATGAGKSACDLITPDVVHAADFTYRVVRQAKSNGAGKNGTSWCTYGDDPDPSHISLNLLALVILTPASLKAQHTTAMNEAKAVASPCTPNAVREFGATEGIGSHAYFCVKPAHSPAGGWVQGGNAYLLEVGTPKVDYGTAAERVTEFESVARAIAKNVGR
jgi:hypothetical protein